MSLSDPVSVVEDQCRGQLLNSVLHRISSNSCLLVCGVNTPIYQQAKPCTSLISLTFSKSDRREYTDDERQTQHICCDPAAVPLCDNSVDAAIIVGISELSKSTLANFFSELVRVLKHDAVLTGLGLFHHLTKRRRNYQGNDPSASASSVQEFRSMMESHGLFVHTTLDVTLEGCSVPEDVQGICVRFLSTTPKKSVKKRRRRAPRTLAIKLKNRALERLKEVIPGISFAATDICISGISLGLPNHNQTTRVFDARNFERMFNGENFISKLDPSEKAKILSQNVVQIIKDNGKRVKVPLTKQEEVIQVAAKLGSFDLQSEYGVPKYMIETLDVTYQLAIAAGLEALKSADIELQTSSKTKFALPDHMQNETGVIFASSFPCLDSCVSAVQDYLERKLESLSNDELRSTAAELFPYADLPEKSFDRKLVFKLLVMANSQLAELIQAKGPNIHINTACSSTSQAICMAEDWIKVGRCRRVVVVSADNPTSSNLLHYIGTGFLALGAATTKPSVSAAATPFDKHRSGMILGMGAVGLVIERSSDSLRRKREPLSTIVGSHFVNSAFHGALLDKQHIAQELESFISDLERKNVNFDRRKLANELVYYSHETCTSARGGCAKTEVDALRAAFGDAWSSILVANTKGLTGHPMGVGIEDVMAVASLASGKVPPVVNHKTVDESLGNIKLSTGGTHSRKYALRFAAGFGSQFAFLLFKKYDAKQKLRRSHVNDTPWEDCCLGLQ